MDKFYKNHQNDTTPLQASQILKTMSDMLKADISMDKYDEYAPAAEELVYYLLKQTEQKQNRPVLSHTEALTLLEFGGAFDINNRDYWKTVQKYIVDSLDGMPLPTIITCLTQLKSTGMLTNSVIVKSINRLKS